MASFCDAMQQYFGVQAWTESWRAGLVAVNMSAGANGHDLECVGCCRRNLWEFLLLYLGLQISSSMISCWFLF